MSRERYAKAEMQNTLDMHQMQENFAAQLSATAYKKPFSRYQNARIFLELSPPREFDCLP